MSSDRRRFRWDSGRLGRGPIQDFWQISRTVQDPSIPNLPLETPAGGASYSLVADGGTYALTGQAASLTATRTITAAGGSYSLTVGNAGLTATRLLSAATGTVSLAGGDAGLTTTRSLSCDPGAFSLTVGDAELTYAPGAPVESGGAQPIGGSDFWLRRIEEEAPKKAVAIIKRVAKAEAPHIEFRLAPLKKAFQAVNYPFKSDYADLYRQVFYDEISKLHHQLEEDDDEVITLLL